MKSVIKTAQSFLLFAVPVTAISTIGTLPSQAVTFALSGAQTEVMNFSVTPSSVNTTTDTDTFVISVGSGSAVAEALADAEFTLEEGDNFSLSQATGDGSNYLAIANSEASLIGRFLLNAQDVFSFDFISELVLETFVENPKTETATAFGEIQFQIIDNSTQTLIDTFGLFGQSFAPSSTGFPNFQPFATGSLSTSLEVESRSDDNSQFLAALLSGTYSRQFDNAADISLFEIKTNQAAVQQVPVPSAALGILAFSFCMLGCTQTKRKQEKLQVQNHRSAA